MVHYNSNSTNGSIRVGSRTLAVLPLLLLTFTGFAQDASPAPVPVEDGLSRAEIISYIVSAVAFIVIIAFAWVLGNGKSRKEARAKAATRTNVGVPGLRISSAQAHDPYMKKKVVKRTS
jgi:hypothetical protein